MAIDISARAYADGVAFDVVCGDEVYGGCSQLREFFEQQQQAYVLRVACTFMLELGAGLRLTCRQAVQKLVGESQWEVRSAGGPGRRGNGGTPDTAPPLSPTMSVVEKCQFKACIASFGTAQASLTRTGRTG